MADMVVDMAGMVAEVTAAGTAVADMAEVIVTAMDSVVGDAVHGSSKAKISGLKTTTKNTLDNERLSNLIRSSPARRPV